MDRKNKKRWKLGRGRMLQSGNNIFKICMTCLCCSLRFGLLLGHRLYRISTQKDKARKTVIRYGLLIKVQRENESNWFQRYNIFSSFMADAAACHLWTLQTSPFLFFSFHFMRYPISTLTFYKLLLLYMCLLRYIHDCDY